jgi:predicted dehydrogenase
MTDNTSAQPKLRLGMVGGGQGAFIGEVHRIAARLDDRYELLAGALSSDPQRAAASAVDIGIDADRSYESFEDMAVMEADREDGIEVATICDKPLTATLAQAEELAELANKSGLLFAVTYNYSAYPMVRLARQLVAQGRLGDIRIVQVEYPQDWLATNIEDDDQKQAAWRTDPEKAGAGGCIGDIGTHAFHLAEFISGLKATELLADLSSFVGQRKLDDNANILLRFDNGAKGSLWSSQIATGNENALRIRLYGDKAGIDWSQENPNYLSLTALGGNKEILSRASASVPAATGTMTRLPAGHPEGFLEAFATLYRDIAEQLNARKSNRECDPEAMLVPGIANGLRGMRFIEKAVSSNAEGNTWQDLR